ncbi:MAG TPA: 1-phosphofructokinase family hexose kinase [Jatrophihabitans sp.]|nr:1-phosphofructokinase family hexose kinase [Jatrophihabitans sp.]
MTAARQAADARVLCVTLNTALDITYTTDSVVLGDVNRVGPTHAHAGGKGVNVARLLAAWGRAATVCGFCGGMVGAEIAASLDEVDIPHRMVPCAGDSRRTITVVHDGSSTGFYEPGPTIMPAEWDGLLAAYEEQLSSAALVVLSGSLPPGVPGDAYRELTAAARARGLPVIVDAHGKPLLHALDAGPSVVTPNETELAEAAELDRPLDLETAAEAARGLVARGAERAVATLGPRGLIGASGDGVWLAVPPAVDGNPTGAGDAVVAVLADSELAGRDWPETLHRAAATAAAAVRMPAAGVVDPEDVAELFEQVEVREL